MCTAAMSSFHCPRSPHLVHTPSHPLLSRLSHCATSLLAALRFAYCHACPLASLSECIPRKPLSKTLDVWRQRFPIVINGEYYSESSEDNIMAMLEHSDRVCEINLRALSSSLLENVMGAMQEPFPILTSLRLCFAGKMASAVPVDPDSILDGSAPSLRSLTLEGVPFPALPALLLTATHLVDITLSNIPHSGYFSPIQIVTCLSDLTSLEKLLIGFESPRSCPERDSRFSLPRERTLLPVLTSFSFKGACK